MSSTTIYVSCRSGKVIVDHDTFEFGMTPDEARQLASLLIKHAADAQWGPPVQKEKSQCTVK